MDEINFQKQIRYKREINIFSNKPYHMDELMFLASTKWIYESEIWVKTHYMRGLRVLCLDFNHVIILKDFHNFLHIMVGQNPKMSKYKENTLLNLI
jgi:hypothetical protein